MKPLLLFALLGLLTNVSFGQFPSNLSDEHSIIPLPQEAKFTNHQFPIHRLQAIHYQDKKLKNEADFLHSELLKIGIITKKQLTKVTSTYTVELRLEAVEQSSDAEAYRLEVEKNNIILRANAPHGIFNGIQTLLQLIDNQSIKTCRITDYPAFAWRGYLIDVGRNYQSIQQIKQQIDVMARYKLNVFHFHLTEDVAWRLAVKKYPQLTRSENMIRQKGKFYSIAEIQDLISYCRKRHILFLPEIDMPGHSDAFKRAMGVDMQSEKGLAIMKEIIAEFFRNFDVPYLHIGGDEVKITNQKFLPEITNFVEKLGKKTVGWSPGGNLLPSTIRQLWVGNKPVPSDFQYIDSRHLYINHFDPFEIVISLFFRQIGGKTQADKNLLGGILCLWHDRNINREQDLLTMNPVYPSMLTFAERSWKGGGEKDWITNISIEETEKIKAFHTFEGRLIKNQKKYFQQLPFPYQPQSQIVWDLFGPYPNEGEVEKSFPPENQDFNAKNPAFSVMGGTVVLRHWWALMVNGVLKKPEENTTWYGFQYYWSKTDTTANLWVGFNNISRSTATDVPAPYQWDDKSSKIWLNDELIKAPNWQNFSRKPSLELSFIDENYEFRPPIPIHLKQGWNVIKVKAPVRSFKGKDFQNPVKWEFTAVIF